MMSKLITLFLVGAVLSGTTYAHDIEELDEAEVKSLKDAYLSAQSGSESKWLNYKDSVYIYLHKGGGKPNHVLAAFDVEGTVIQTHTGNSLPQHERDWEFVNEQIASKISAESRPTAVGHKARVVMFENQYGVALGYVSLNQVKARVELFTNALNIPTTVFISVKKDTFRKPHDGMFRLYERAFSGEESVDLSKSFYVGDSAGEPAPSDYDKRFAQRIGLPFVTPFDYLNGKKPELVLD